MKPSLLCSGPSSADMAGSRRGTSYIVEASLIYPMIVAVTVMLLAAAVYLYGLTAACSDLNRSVRRAAGERSGTVFYNESDQGKLSGSPVTESEGLLFKKVSATSEKTYTSSILFKILRKNKYRAEVYVISEVDVLWNRQAVEHAAEILTGQE